MGLNTDGLEKILDKGKIELKRVFQFSFFGREYMKFKILTLDNENYTNPRKIKIGSFSSLTYPSGNDYYSGRIYEDTLKISSPLKRISNDTFFFPKVKIISKRIYGEMIPMNVEYEKYFLGQNGLWVEVNKENIKGIIGTEELFNGS